MSKYPTAINPELVGTYPLMTKAGGGAFYDDVLEYRVWCHSHKGGGDFFNAFSTYEEALAFSRTRKGAEKPLVLVRQKEWIFPPRDREGKFTHEKGERLTEWGVEWLSTLKRGPDSIKEYIEQHSK